MPSLLAQLPHQSSRSEPQNTAALSAPPCNVL